MRVHDRGRLSVVGAGGVGLSVAWRAACAGWRVRLHDPLPARGASWVAGGMLAPLTEGWPGEEDALVLNTDSLHRWPDFAAALSAGAGTDAGLGAAGTLVVGLDSADVGELAVLAEWLAARGRTVTELGRRELRERVPALAQGIRRGLDVPGDLAVDNRALLAALQAACLAAGVELVHEAVTDLAALPADQVVLAAGAGSPALVPSLPVRAVKGEILRLRHRRSVLPAPGCTVRGVVHGRHVYLVPRSDGIVVGATQHEVGEDRDVTVGGVRDLIADAEAVLPSIAEYELTEAIAGLRPMTPDNLPLIGRLDERTVAATGHGRNGLLLLPLTADAVLAELDGSPLPEAAPAHPRRFS
ncbi:glycine oxidase ThiO [Rhodococcus sp. X156]|uniref:glycine oxidase ThiO n=1 Tax=Rhodococcus sp. X156 TaxID=2499145 RepID=UPI000FDBEEDB|nr:glycine oxidase ThiO [Rhodococcus sp. X156]